VWGLIGFACAAGAVFLLQCCASCAAGRERSIDGTPYTPCPCERSTAADAYGIGAASDKATAKLLGAALGGGSDEAGGGDVELATTSARIGAGYAPRWVRLSESIRVEMSIMKERITKLKGCAM